MEIRKAERAELDAIVQMYQDTTVKMRSQGMFQWGDHYPSRSLLASDLDNEKMYVAMEDARYVGVVVLNEEQDQEWDRVNWRYHAGKTLVIHRLAVHPIAQGKGIAKELLAFAEVTAREGGYGQIRLDSFSENPIASKLYVSAGYEQIGEVNVKEGLPFLCMEKKMSL